MIKTMPCGCQYQPCVGHAFTLRGVEPPLPEGWVYAIGWEPDMLFKRAADCAAAHVDADGFEYVLMQRSAPADGVR